MFKIAESRCTVSMFVDPQYQGAHHDYTENATVVEHNNQYSSLKITPAGCCVDVYQQKNFGGPKATFCKNEPQFRDWINDGTSSLKVYGKTNYDCTLGPQVSEADCTVKCGTVVQKVTKSESGNGVCAPAKIDCKPGDGQCPGCSALMFVDPQYRGIFDVYINNTPLVAHDNQYSSIQITSGCCV